jgi:D-alanine-D-alanine ligase
MKIAVVFGGHGEERDVSIASAARVFQALKARGHEVTALDTARGALGPEGERRLLEYRIAPRPPELEERALWPNGRAEWAGVPDLRDADAVFLALHGGAGEDGTLQAVLDCAGLPYTGSGPLGSGLAMDKSTAKRLFRSHGVPTPDWLMAPAAAEEYARLGFPVIVKPNKQGSTVGLTLVRGADRLAAAVAEAFRHDEEVLVERYISGRELTIGILEGQALAVGEIMVAEAGVFDYQSKYQPGGARELFPADLTAAQTRAVRDLAVRAHQALKLRDYSRVDFRLDADGGFWCLEANSLPGLTATSLFPQSAAAAGIPFGELCERLCRMAVERGRGRGMENK